MLIDCRGGKISAETRGEGKPILVLHGGGLDRRHMLDSLEPAFDDTAGWQRVYIDLPGHGMSSVSDKVGSQDDVLDVIRSFVERSFGGEKFAVIGESRGSYHAMALSCQMPDSLLGMALIVADGMPGATVNWRPEHQVLVPAESDQPMTAEAQARFDRLVVQSPDVLQKIIETKLPAAKLADQNLADRLKQAFNFSFDLTAVFDKPSLIINGRQDAMAGYQDMVDAQHLYPRATFAVLDCAGHSLTWERPGVFQALLVDWLERMNFFWSEPTV